MAGRSTSRPKTNSNDKVFFGINKQIRIRFSLLRKFCFLMIRIFGVFGVESYAMRLYLCMCCGLFAPTQFHFECCVSLMIHENIFLLFYK